MVEIFKQKKAEAIRFLPAFYTLFVVSLFVAIYI